MGKGTRALQSQLSLAAKTHSSQSVRNDNREPPSVQEQLWSTRPRTVKAPVNDNPLLRAYADHTARTTPRGRHAAIPGPAPPRTWAALWKGPRPVRSRHTGSKGTERMSLQFLCIRAIAQNLKLYKNQPEDFWYIPFYHKERILCEVSGLQDNQLHLFEDEQLQSLSLHRSTVKVSTLADFFGISLVEEEDAFVTFEQSSKLLVDEEEPLDSWEQYESSEIDNPPPIIPCNGFNISSLDISFSVLLSGIATAKLISLALPRLQRLSIAGCFDFAEGPSTLGILSRNLLRLEDLDISHCNWATAQALSYVGWDSRWFTVMVLRAVNCDRTVEQFKFDVKSQRPGLKVII